MFNGTLDHNINVIRSYDRHPIGIEDYEKHLALAHTGLQINDLIHPKIQQLLGSQLRQSRFAVLNNAGLRTDLVDWMRLHFARPSFQEFVPGIEEGHGTLPRRTEQFGTARTYQCVASVLEMIAERIN